VVLTLSSRLSVSFRNHQVKNATWFCLLALLVLFSGLVFLFKRISKLERLRLDAADVRVKLLNETMQGIKVIKLMGMLTPHCIRVKSCRSLVLLRGIKTSLLFKLISIPYSLVCSVGGTDPADGRQGAREGAGVCAKPRHNQGLYDSHRPGVICH